MNTPGYRERGAVMIVTLLFLVILTMLGITAMTGATMEERMAGNTRDAAIALQAAEAALRDARRDINRMPYVNGASLRGGKPLDPSDFFRYGTAPGECITTSPYEGFCRPALNPDETEYLRSPGAILPHAPRHNMKGSPSVGYGDVTGYPELGGEGADKLAAQPRYFIELFCLQTGAMSIGNPSELCKFYRITAAGYGRNPNTVVRLQEVIVPDR